MFSIAFPCIGKNYFSTSAQPDSNVFLKYNTNWQIYSLKSTECVWGHLYISTSDSYYRSSISTCLWKWRNGSTNEVRGSSSGPFESNNQAQCCKPMTCRVWCRCKFYKWQCKTLTMILLEDDLHTTSFDINITFPDDMVLNLEIWDAYLTKSENILDLLKSKIQNVSF